MKLIISASECDTSTLKIAEALRLVFQKFEDQLSGNYDGVIEHLWIDLELSEMSFKAFGKPPKPLKWIHIDKSFSAGYLL